MVYLWEIVVNGVSWQVKASKVHTAISRAVYGNKHAIGEIRWRCVKKLATFKCPVCKCKYYEGEDAIHAKTYYHKRAVEDKMAKPTEAV